MPGDQGSAALALCGCGLTLLMTGAEEDGLPESFWWKDFIPVEKLASTDFHKQEIVKTLSIPGWGSQGYLRETYPAV